MSLPVSMLIVTLVLAPSPPAPTAPATAALTALLDEFLSGASRGDAAIHDRFWAEDLIYTRGSGRRIGKTEILHDVRTAPAPKPDGPTTTYTAEEVRIQQYGATAVVAFRLVGTTQRSGKAEVSRFLNTGTFLKRGGKWQAVAWQATRMPRPEEDARGEVAAAEASLHRAVLAGDVKGLESSMDEKFVWTHRSGERTTRQQLMDDLASGRLKYSKLETHDVTVTMHGDAAVVRGVSERQRSSFAGSEGVGDPSPFTAFYTLTFVNQGDGWKAVAMHSNRSPGN